MYKISYYLGHPKKEFEQLMENLGGTIENQKWSFDSELGKGYKEFIEIEEGLILHFYETTYYKQVVFERIDIPAETYFIINFDLSGTLISIDNLEIESQICSGIFIATSRTNVSFIQPVNKRCRGVKLIVKKEWIEHNLISNIKEENSLTNYLLNIETPYCDFKSIDSNSFALLKEIFSSSNQPFKKINIKANALKLMEILFNELIRQEALPYNEINFSDLSKVINVKNKFLTDFSKECPPLKMLSSYSCMSESKFSKLFKQVYGLPFYKFYNTQRMIYAKELLETGIYNVQEVSEMIGYQNAGKFSKSFKNQFKLLPHKIISTSKTG